MTKAELIDKVLSAKGMPELSKKAMGQVVDQVFDTISVAIKKEKGFSYPGFGTFKVRTRKARTGRNPRTGEKIKIKASKNVAFKAAPKLKGRL